MYKGTAVRLTFDFVLEVTENRRQSWRSLGAERKQLPARNHIPNKTISQKGDKDVLKYTKTERICFYRSFLTRNIKGSSSGINLTKKLQNLYLENYKMSLREILKDLNTWKNMPCSVHGAENLLLGWQHPRN